MSIKKLSILCLFLLCATKFYAQQKATAQFSVGYQKNNTNDTVWLVVNRAPEINPGSLMVITSVVGNSNTCDTAYFPVIDTASVFGLAVPEAYRTSVLHVRALFYPQIFEVTGKALSKMKSKMINALIITNNKRLYNKDLALNEDNYFALPGLVFEKQATVIFNYPSSAKQGHPDVSIQQVPTVKDFKDTVFVADIPLAVELPKKDTAVPATTTVDNHPQQRFVDTASKYKKLTDVVVVGRRKTNAQKFNEAYTTPLFQDLNERVIDCIDDPSILSYPDCISYLRSQVPGLVIDIDKFGESVVHWRGHEMKAFYIDEIAVDIDQLLSINVADIAIIKAFPPPFSGGNGTGDGGAIAIYTRRGEFRLRNDPSDNKWIYSIKGYSAPMHVLFSGK